uniref:Uncharacterized protein n=2 Tax=Lygus hesperus TaxID=30085 RepID=A0A146MG11_LYGHE
MMSSAAVTSAPPPSMFAAVNPTTMNTVMTNSNNPINTNHINNLSYSQPEMAMNVPPTSSNVLPLPTQPSPSLFTLHHAHHQYQHQYQPSPSVGIFPTAPGVPSLPQGSGNTSIMDGTPNFVSMQPLPPPPQLQQQQQRPYIDNTNGGRNNNNNNNNMMSAEGGAMNFRFVRGTNRGRHNDRYMRGNGGTIAPSCMMPPMISMPFMNAPFAPPPAMGVGFGLMPGGMMPGAGAMGNSNDIPTVFLSIARFSVT